MSTHLTPIHRMVPQFFFFFFVNSVSHVKSGSRHTDVQSRFEKVGSVKEPKIYQVKST